MGQLNNLKIYSKAVELTVQIYQLINSKEKLRKDFSLCDQIKRASISVAANISEGYYRTSKLSKNYYHIASGSANEIVTLLEIIKKVYIIETEVLQEEYRYLAKQISAFTNSF